MNDIRKNPVAYIKAFGTLYMVMAYLTACVESAINNHRMARLFEGKSADSFDAFFEEFISALIRIFPVYIIEFIPIVLFLIYIAVGYPKKKNHFLMKVSFLVYFALFAFASVSSISYFIECTTKQGVTDLVKVMQILNIEFKLRSTVVWGIYAFVAICKFKYMKAARITAVISLLFRVFEYVANFIVYSVYVTMITEYLELAVGLFFSLLFEATIIIFWFCAIQPKDALTQKARQPVYRQF